MTCIVVTMSLGQAKCDQYIPDPCDVIFESEDLDIISQVSWNYCLNHYFLNRFFEINADTETNIEVEHQPFADKLPL